MSVKVTVYTTRTVIESNSFRISQKEAERKISEAIYKGQTVVFPGEKQVMINPKHIISVELEEVADELE